MNVESTSNIVNGIQTPAAATKVYALHVKATSKFAYPAHHALNPRIVCFISMALYCTVYAM